MEEESYKQLPEQPVNKNIPDKEMSGLALFFTCFIMVIIGGGLAFGVVVLGLSPQFLTDQDCKALVDNATNQSFINGSLYTNEYILYSLTSLAIECEQIPVTYQNISYTLYPLECLNLNSTRR